MLARASIDRASRLCDLIDAAVPKFRGRTLVSAAEVVDLLLDLRFAVELECSLDVPVAG
jgi:hypothetical protein